MCVKEIWHEEREQGEGRRVDVRGRYGCEPAGRDQFAFKTDRALSCLTFKGVKEVS